jgi:hypothetical protein
VANVLRANNDSEILRASTSTILKPDSSKITLGDLVRRWVSGDVGRGAINSESIAAPSWRLLDALALCERLVDSPRGRAVRCRRVKTDETGAISVTGDGVAKIVLRRPRASGDCVTDWIRPGVHEGAKALGLRAGRRSKPSDQCVVGIDGDAKGQGAEREGAAHLVGGEMPKGRFHNCDSAKSEEARLTES